MALLIDNGPRARGTHCISGRDEVLVRRSCVCLGGRVNWGECSGRLRVLIA